jgi:two-component system, OmpR family, phosphate regulon sensor histidine kinase PhoR
VPAGRSDDSQPSKYDEVLTDIGQMLAGCDTPGALYHTLYEQTSKVVDSTGFLVGLYDEAVQTVTIVYQVDTGVELPGGSFPLGSGFTSQVIRTHQPSLIRRWSMEGPRVRIQYATDQKGLPESGITVPLLLGARVVGVLSVQSYIEERYDETDLLRMQVIAGQAAIAIDRLQSGSAQNGQLPKRVSELETIIAGMSEALLIVDARGAITRLNRVARDLLCPENGTGEIVLGQPLDTERWGQWALGPRSVAEALRPLIEALRRGEALNDLEIEVHSGGRRTFSFSCATLRDAAGDLTGGVIVFRDVTGRREVERMKDEMLSIASHELKGPISVIKGHAQILESQVTSGRATTESMKHGLAAIVQSSERLAGLLDLLLDLSRIEAGRLELDPIPTDLVALTRSVVERTRAVAARHRLEVRGPDHIEGTWDARRLEQLLHNLLANAVKYSPMGGTVEIELGADDQTATVSVRDEGIGLLQEDLPRVFERFYRAEGVRKLEGTGLGLYICQGIVSAHGGRIWAESPGHGRGTTFSFALPRGVAGYDASPPSCGPALE